MARRPEPPRVELANYPFHWAIDSAFSDMDVAGHINNVSLARYYETGRTRWLMALTGDPLLYKRRSLDTVVAECTLRFLKEVNFPDQVIVATGVGRIGNSSFSCLQGLFVGGDCVGLNDAAMVLTRHGRPAPIEGEIRERMEKHLIANG